MNEYCGRVGEFIIIFASESWEGIVPTLNLYINKCT